MSIGKEINYILELYRLIAGIGGKDRAENRRLQIEPFMLIDCYKRLAGHAPLNHPGLRGEPSSMR